MIFRSRNDLDWLLKIDCSVGKMPGNGRREEERNGIERDEEEEEFEVEEVRERLESSRGSRFNLLNKELRVESFRRKFSRESVINGFRDLSKVMVIYPDHNRYVSLSLSTLSLFPTANCNDPHRKDRTCTCK